MSLWVLGSGPISTLPKNPPRIVIFVKGSVAHIPKLPSSGFEKWLMILGNLYPESASSLFCGSDLSLKSHHSILREVIRAHSPYERLIVRQSQSLSVAKVIAEARAQKLASEFQAFTYRKMMRSMRQLFSRRELYSLVLGPEKIRLESVKRLVSARRMLDGRYSKPSTGVAAALFALDEVYPGEEIHLLGITANDVSYPFTTGRESNRQHHLNADLNILSAVQRKFPGNPLFVHDRDLRVAINRFDQSAIMSQPFE